MKIVPPGHAATPAEVHGTNVTVPSAFTVYFPLFDSVRVVRLQFVPVNGAVALAAHSLTDDGLRVEYADAVSLPRTLMTWVWFCSSYEVSFDAVGGGGTTGVSVEVAVCPVASVTRYVTGVFVPGVAPADAANVTTPVDVFTVYVPCPEITTDDLHTESAGSIRQVADVVKAGPPDEARPPVPVNVVNATDEPGRTVFCWDEAVGAGGGVTVGVTVDADFCPSASTAT